MQRFYVHNTIMAGQPGAGKTLLARSLPVILPRITVKPPDQDDRKRNVHERLSRIAQASHFRYRLVTLSGSWWVESGVPLLGFGPDFSYFVLKPARGRYLFLEPATGTETRISKSNADQFMEQVYMIYATFPKSKTNRAIVSFALETARNDGWWMVGAALMVAMIGLLVPIITGVIVGQAIPFARYSFLVELVLILVAVAVGSTLFRVIQGLATARVNARVDLCLQPAEWDHVMHLPSSFFRRYGAGDLTQRVLGIKTISNILSSTAIGAFLAGILSLTSVIVMVYYDLPMTLFAALLAFGISLLIGLLSRSQLKWTRLVFTLIGRVQNLVLQILSAIPKIRVAAAEERVFARWADAYARLCANQIQAAVVRNVTETLMIALPIFGSIGLFLIAGLRGGTLDVAAFIAFNAAFGLFMTGALTLNQAITSSINVIPLFDRLKPVLDAPQEIDPNREDPGKLTGRISLSNVFFRYHEDGPVVLRNVYFEIEPGKFVALVGPSGAGNSTILRLLLGFEKPQSGAVYYDGKELGQLDLLLVRRQIGTVLQSVGLIPGSIYDNIAGASPLSREQVMEAISMAGLEDDIKAMLMGLDTIESEGGGNLSGGQQQRLMIARVLIHKPGIILFDEATSALDNRTQAIVTESLEKFHTTRVVIAHRLSTIRQADNILVIENGQLVQQGNFDELIKVDGLFKKLAERQIV